MRTYAYVAREASGAVRRGQVEAPNLPAALVEVSGEEARVLRIREMHPGLLAQRPRITEHELALLFRHLGAMIETGVSLGEGVDVLRRDSPNQHLHHVLDEVARSLARGRPLSEGLEKFPLTFSSAQVALVRAGEKSGQLPTLLGEIADHLEQSGDISRRLVAALIYPAIVGLTLVVVAASFLLMVLPQYVAIYKDLGIGENMPWITRALLRVSSVAFPAIIILAAAALIAVWVWAASSRSRTGFVMLDSLKLRVPFLGQVVYHAGLARFASALGLLLRHRVPNFDALALAGEGCGSPEIARGARRTAAGLSRGRGFAASMEEAEVFPKALIARVAAAEAGGTLPEALKSTGDFYAGHARHLAALFGAVIEPFFVILLGIGVAFVFGGVFAPLMRAITSLMSPGGY